VYASFPKSFLVALSLSLFTSVRPPLISGCPSSVGICLNKVTPKYGPWQLSPHIPAASRLRYVLVVLRVAFEEFLDNWGTTTRNPLLNHGRISSPIPLSAHPWIFERQSSTAETTTGRAWPGEDVSSNCEIIMLLGADKSSLALGHPHRVFIGMFSGV